MTVVNKVSTYRQIILSFSGASGLQTAAETGLDVGNEIMVGPMVGTAVGGATDTGEEVGMAGEGVGDVSTICLLSQCRPP